MLRVVRKEILVIRFRNVTNNECAIKITPVGRDRRFARPGWFALMWDRRQ